ncbi:MAG: response regulator, partial [Methylotenera sp.]
MQAPTTVLIIDDHALFRRGVRQMISADPEFLVVGEAASGTEGIVLVEQLKPDLV